MRSTFGGSMRPRSLTFERAISSMSETALSTGLTEAAAEESPLLSPAAETAGD
jgi:hypothetical protein